LTLWGDRLAHQKFTEWIEHIAHEVIEKLKGSEQIILIHHDDADGITSAAIIKALSDHIGVKVRLICLEKLYPQALDLIGTYSDPLIFVDLGSPHVKLISKKVENTDTILILDHHDPDTTEDPRIVHVNPELFGISGEEEASASIVTYLFVRSLLENSKLLNKLIPLALIGSSELPGDVKGLNLAILEEAIRRGVAKTLSSHNISVFINGRFISRTKLSTELTILASVGYYRGGPDLAINACLEGFTREIKLTIADLRRYRSSLYKKGMDLIKSHLYKGKCLQWIDVRDLFYNVGAKVLGTFLSFVSYRLRMIDPELYLVGTMNLNPELPGLGRLKGEYVKVSIRVPRSLALKIEQGCYPPASQLLMDVCNRLGGFADGHAYAASGIIPLSKKRQLINLLEEAAQHLSKVGRKEGTLDSFF